MFHKGNRTLSKSIFKQLGDKISLREGTPVEVTVN